MRTYDNTRLSTYKKCPRKYYFRHVRDWRTEGLSVDLGFGLAWHDAMDIVWAGAQHEDSQTAVREAAFARFCETWTEQGFPDPYNTPAEEFEKYKTKTPGIAQNMLYNYISQRWSFLQSIQLIAIEKPFMVPLYPDRSDLFYIGRNDKIFRTPDESIITAEHKTTGSYKADGGFRDDYLEQWSPNSQVDGYCYSGHMEYGDDFSGVWVDAALAHKKVHDKFKFIPVARNTGHLDAWLYETRDWIARIEDELENLEHYRMADPMQRPNTYLPGFPKETGACWDYGKPCPYKDVCTFVSNPETLHEPPQGFIVDKWEPFDVLGIAALLNEPDNADQKGLMGDEDA